MRGRAPRPRTLTQPTTDPPRDLRAFLDRLRGQRELVEIDAEVDPELEIAEVHRRVIAAGGPALLFRRVRGSSFPVVTNLFGSKRRVETAFGSRPETLVRELARLPAELLPPTFGKLWEKRSLLGSLSRIGLERRASGSVTEVAQDPPRLTGSRR
jgi:3-polyprenyl-4-hydroxybenzoate decarboxylase